MIDAIPSWLRPDTAGSARADSQVLQGALNSAHDNWLQDAQMSLAQDTHKTQQQMAGVQIETAKSKLQEQQQFAADTPLLLDYNRKLKTAKSQEELDAIPLPDVKTLQAAQLLQQGRTYQEGEIAKYKLQGYASDVTRGVQDWTLAYGEAPTGQDLLEIKQAAAAKADPATAIKGLATEQRGLDALDRTNAAIQGRLNLAQIKDLTKAIGGVRAGQVQTAVENGVKALESSGIPVTDADIAAFTSGAMVGNGAVNASAAVVKNLESENSVFQNLDEAISHIERFNTKYGDRAFEDFVGPLDSAITKLDSKWKSTKNLPEKEKRAIEIFRETARIVQGYRNGQFGTALTGNETESFKGIVADPSFNDYEDALKTFRNGAGRSVRIYVNDHKLAPNISLEIKKRFLGSGGFAPNEDGVMVRGGGTPEAAAAAVVTPAKIPTFNTAAEAEAAKVPKGTIVIIGGKKYVSE